MKTIKQIALSLVIALGLVATPLALTAPVDAASAQEELCKGAGGQWSGDACSNTNDTTGGVEKFFRTIVEVLLFLIGAISVLMIVYGGIRYTISGGDQNSVTAAKNTVLYAVIGLVVALLGYAIVTFVVNSIGA